MNETEFWAIIEASKTDDRDAQYEHLKTELAKLDRDALIGFDTQYRTQLSKAFHWDLWAAAYIIGGGCGDDGFDYFCDWLIAQGETVFNAALTDPESLTDHIDSDDCEFEEFRYAMGEVFEQKFGEPMPWDKTQPPRGEPAGEEWDEDTVEQKYPKLAAAAEAAFASAPQTPPPPIGSALKPAMKKQGKRVLTRIVMFSALFVIFYVMNKAQG